MNVQSFEHLQSEVHSALSNAESALEPAAGIEVEKSAELRASALAKIRAARAQLTIATGRALERGRAAAKATDEYAHAHPWRLVGAAAAVGVVLGLLLSRNR